MENAAEPMAVDDDKLVHAINTPQSEQTARTEMDAVDISPATISTTPQHDELQTPESNGDIIVPAATAIVSTIDDKVDAKPTYGTRSRNRGGASRPNYAEDKELDHDFEIQAAPTKAELSRKVAQSGDHAASNKLANGHASITHRDYGTDAEASKQSQVGTKDQIPGTSSFPATSTSVSHAPITKKRKAPAVATNQLSSSTTVQSTRAPQQSLARQGSISTQVMNGYRETCMLSFDRCGAKLQDRKLISDDGIVLGINDHVYMVCEPPGEPYYIGRIMEFLHVDNDSSKAVEALQMNWFYRAREIGKRVADTRQLYASMHTDTSPLTALRGPCQIVHRSEVVNLDDYRNQQNCFYFDKLFDRYIQRTYDVIPTSTVVNVPARVKRALDERWRYIVVEAGRGKELTSAVKSCKRCSGYCASNDSVDCAVCEQTYHMDCVRPPLLKKPSRGFAWACGPCSRAQEKKLQERIAPTMPQDNEEVEEMAEEEEEHYGSGLSSLAESDNGDLAVRSGTAEQVYQASLWPWRYLGIHCSVEDALDYDDRIHPRASSRLGARHQADVLSWPGRPFELVQPPKAKRKPAKGGGGKKECKQSKAIQAAAEAERLARENRPKWIIDGPTDYTPRGEDHENDAPNNTATLLYRPIPPRAMQAEASGEDPAHVNAEELDIVADYMFRAQPFAEKLATEPTAVNFIDKAINILWRSNYDIDTALRNLSKVSREDLKEPDLTPLEIKKFEDGVAKFGSELLSVKKHVKSVTPGNIVRYYYVWKKTARGKQIWGNYSGRKGKKEAKKVDPAVGAGKLQDDVAHDQDDSAFDNRKAALVKRGFQCKFCLTRSSRQWRRAPGTAAGTTVSATPNIGTKVAAKDKGPQLMVALCIQCAVVWRKYAVQWEDNKDVLANGGRVDKRRKVEDPMREFQLNELNLEVVEPAVPSPVGTPVPQLQQLTHGGQEPARKKLKPTISNTPIAETSENPTSEPVVPLPPPPAPVFVPPKPRTLPCAICLQMEPSSPDQLISCRDCRMHVHRNCYGIVNDIRGKWSCDMCSNDRDPKVSLLYECVLCPLRLTPQDFIGPLPKPSHKKKTEKDRERERALRENAIMGMEYYRRKQEEMNKPIHPREPLKCTVNNNWVHVTCAVFTPEVKFGNAKALGPSEGIGSIESTRYDEVCKICHTNIGACISCHHCKEAVHIGCANANGYILGFDITPVKSSRKDVVSTVNVNGEAGSMTAMVWCKEHPPTKTIVHAMHEVVDETGLNALQLFAQTYKQADLTLTGTVRKANLIQQSTRSMQGNTVTAGTDRRRSTTVLSIPGHAHTTNGKDEGMAEETAAQPEQRCITCDTDVSPRWWPYSQIQATDVKKEVPESSSDDRVEQTVETAAGSGVVNGNGDSKHENGKSEPAFISAVSRQVNLAKAVLVEAVSSGLWLEDDAGMQCHKCHHNKVQKKVRSPTPPLALPLPTPVLPLPVHASFTSPIPAVGPVLAHHSGQTTLSWPGRPPLPQPAYSPSADFWTRPTPGPIPGPMHRYSEAPSPRTPLAAILGGLPPQLQRAPTSEYRTPMTNGLSHIPHNSYAQSQHRPSASPYQTYASPSSAPVHMTNGTTTLARPPDHSFVQPTHNSIHQRSPYHNPQTLSQASPQALPQATPLIDPSLESRLDPRMDPHLDPRMIPESATTRVGSGQPALSSTSQPQTTRVNGGASASPSLQNLLS